MKRVEFIGANGVGKTTVLNQVLAQVSGPLHDQQQGRAEVATAGLKRLPFKKRVGRQLAMSLSGRRTRRVKQLRDKRVARLLERQEGALREFVEQAMAIIAASDLSVAEKRNEMAWFFDALYDALYFDASDLEAAALCDESISLKTLMVAMLTPSAQAAQALFERMPRPALLVAVNGAEQAIYRRLVAREQHVPRSAIHYLRDRSREEVVGQLARLQDTAARGCEILERRGTQVIRLNVDESDTLAQTRILRPALNALVE